MSKLDEQIKAIEIRSAANDILESASELSNLLLEGIKDEYGFNVDWIEDLQSRINRRFKSINENMKEIGKLRGYHKQ